MTYPIEYYSVINVINEDFRDPCKKTVYFVGIHHKEGLSALDSSTRGGKLIDRVIERLPADYLAAKTNLFRMFNMLGPKRAEMMAKEWVRFWDPQEGDAIVLLGDEVQKWFPETPGVQIINSKHPAACWSKSSQQEFIDNIINKL